MIEVICGCATPRKLPESSVGKKFRCPGCSKIIQIVSGEQLAEGNGAGDFDAGLEITAGPDQVGTRLLLGGVADVQIGKLPDRQIILNATKVSRAHCKVQRVDFGPSKWKVVDNKSTNGLFVNGQRVTEEELHDDDMIGVGEYELKFTHFSPPAPQEDEDLLPVAPTAAAAPRAHGRSFSDLRVGGDGPGPVASGPKSAAAAMASRPMSAARAAAAEARVSTAGGPDCPSCSKTLVVGAKYCVACGININTGRPMLTSQGVDEDSLYENAYQWIRWISILVPLTPMPIPIRSAAFGTRKPYTIWTIAALTIVASIAFFVAQWRSDDSPAQAPGTNLMLWAPGEFKVSQQKMHSIARKLTEEQREELRDRFEQENEKLSDDELVDRAVGEIIQERAATRGEFHWYQLITHAFLHDTSSIFGFIMHLSGNLLFMLVFGTRVNSLIGNLATAIIYPILAVGAAASHLALSADSGTPMLGASGAIMGLAGLYLILFPVHRVYCAMWIRLWLRFYTYFAGKIFQLRGFWILLIYFGYDLLMNAIMTHFGFSEGVAHMAHIGGFTIGMILGLAILFSRLFNTRGSDVLSVILGKHAWPLIGKPSRWSTEAPQYPQAVSLNYQ